MDEQKQEKLRAIEELITRDITELTEFAGELDKVQISLIAEHLIDLEYAVESIVHILREPSRPEVLDTRSRRWM